MNYTLAEQKCHIRLYIQEIQEIHTKRLHSHLSIKTGKT
ncbi:MAG: hypothetical protein JETT_0166 [Candidatus Jettenia ecosi]|uniref:Uncharacterized protein n=1 Tax=Candidatus Jettenia ecosi TaxID=2494326 RepID=A0A533QFH1_9BACT|nr:MAG: hypothetical protein JETT_0166 [Candidatus Jettenia ecosi]